MQGRRVIPQLTEPPIAYSHNKDVTFCVCLPQEGLTPLIVAVKEGYTELVKILLEAQADPNIQEPVRTFIGFIITNFCVCLSASANELCTTVPVSHRYTCTSLHLSFCMPLISSQCFIWGGGGALAPPARMSPPLGSLFANLFFS